MKKETLTIEEAAAYLQIGKRSLYRLANERKIPGKKIVNKIFSEFSINNRN